MKNLAGDKWSAVSAAPEDQVDKYRQDMYGKEKSWNIKDRGKESQT
jgi:hypothetical protein